jgi:cysteine-rich repeat protein
MNARRAARLVLLLFLLGSPARAGEHPIAGDLLRLKDSPAPDGRQVVLRAARDPAIVPSLANDPRQLGATFQVVGAAPGDGATGVIVLPGAQWKGLGRPAGSKGFRFLDRGAVHGIEKVVFRGGAKGGTLAVTGRGRAWPYMIRQPQGAIDVRFAVGGELYCTRFTRFAKNRAGKVIAREASAPPSCGTLTPTTCGNGTREGSEECDDGNRVDGDGCSASCLLENASGLCAGVATGSGAHLASRLVVSGLDQPVHVAAPRLDPRRLFVVEQPGRIRIVKDEVLLADAFLDISTKVRCCQERGLLSVAFHPDFRANGRFFVYYTNSDGALVIARYQVSADPDVADASSGHILLTIPHPTYGNHNGGQLAFGPDGYLYAGTGDGGGGGDPFENAQNSTVLLGKLLRLDVNIETPPYYVAPPSNPFVAPGDPGRDEIWAFGLRNPWRFSFDRATRDLYIGDVGQDTWEEVDVQPAASTGGENYGWDVFEGRHCFEPAPAPSCPDPPDGFTMPVLEYAHGTACSITGGFVYRGCSMPDLRGTYFYSDYCECFIRTFQGVSGGDAQNLADRTAELRPGAGRTFHHIVSFGEDARGELYIVDYDGELFEIVPGS